MTLLGGSRRRHSTAEKVLAWGSMLLLMSATVAAIWLAVGPIAGLLMIALFAGATGWCAATDNLIQREDDDG